MSPKSVVFLRNFLKNISKSVNFFFFLLIYPVYLIWLLLCDLVENLPFSLEIFLLVIDIILLRKGYSSGVSNIHFLSEFSPSLISPFSNSQINKDMWYVSSNTGSDFESPGRKKASPHSCFLTHKSPCVAWFFFKVICFFCNCLSPSHHLSVNYEVMFEYYGFQNEAEDLNLFLCCYFPVPAEPLGEPQEGLCLDDMMRESV